MECDNTSIPPPRPRPHPTLAYLKFTRQILCDRRLVPTHAFTLGVLCRLVLGAAADEDWPATASYAERALSCMQGLRAGMAAAASAGDAGRVAERRSHATEVICFSVCVWCDFLEQQSWCEARGGGGGGQGGEAGCS